MRPAAGRGEEAVRLRDELAKRRTTKKNSTRRGAVRTGHHEECLPDAEPSPREHPSEEAPHPVLRVDL